MCNLTYLAGESANLTTRRVVRAEPSERLLTENWGESFHEYPRILENLRKEELGLRWVHVAVTWRLRRVMRDSNAPYGGAGGGYNPSCCSCRAK